MQTEQPHLYTTHTLFNRVKEWITELKTKDNKLQNFLDVPAGGGKLTQFLNEDLKVQVSASDIDQEKWDYSKIELKPADLGRKLPFPDESFDMVVCMEGLKHVTDAATAVAELTRVLKKGGRLMITIPNDLCMQARLRYFFDGFVDIDWGSMDPNSENSKTFLYMQSQLSLPYLYYFLEKNNLKFIESRSCHLRFWSVLLAVIFYPFIYFSTTKRLPKGHPLRKEMTSMVWLAGKRNILLTEKV